MTWNKKKTKMNSYKIEKKFHGFVRISKVQKKDKIFFMGNNF